MPSIEEGYTSRTVASVRRRGGKLKASTIRSGTSRRKGLGVNIGSVIKDTSLDPKFKLFNLFDFPNLSNLIKLPDFKLFSLSDLSDFNTLTKAI